MGPAKVSPTITKIRIKGYQDLQKHVNVSSSTKKRKILDLGTTWTDDELKCFHKAYHRHGKDWKKISAAVGLKSPDMVKSLYSMHRTFLSLPKHQATSMGFIALVTGHRNALELSPSHRRNGQAIRTSGKAKKHGEATQHKVHEAPQPHDSYRAGTITGFSPSFKKRYYGELARSSQSHSVRNRTPRIPVIVPTDRSATDDSKSELKNTISSTKRSNERINNDGAKFSMNEYSLDGRSGIMEATKAVEYQAFSKNKGTGDTEIYQTQQPFKKRRTDQTMERGQTSKVGHETMMKVEEGDKPFGLLEVQQMARVLISADDLLILDMLQSMVNTPDKMSKLKINTPSGTQRKSDLTLSEKKDEGHYPVDIIRVSKNTTFADCFQARNLLHCLSSESLRRWCTYGWFYSAVDFPWFMDNEFAKYLNHPLRTRLSAIVVLLYSYQC